MSNFKFFDFNDCKPPPPPPKKKKKQMCLKICLEILC